MSETILPTIPMNRSWRLRDLRDTRENVLAAVQSAATVPDDAKAVLIAAVNALDPRINLVSLDAHATCINRGIILNIHVAPI